MPFAFRCRVCGHLLPSAAAGERQAPSGCPICRATSWEVLAAATPERLVELGISPADVALHTPISKAESTRAGIETCRENLAFLAAKEAAWQANCDASMAEYARLDAEHSALEARMEASGTGDLAALADSRERVRMGMHALECAEFTPRDLQSRAHNEAELVKLQAEATAVPRSVLVRAADAAKTTDHS